MKPWICLLVLVALRPSVSAVETNLLPVYFIGISFTDPVRSGELAKLATTSTPTA